MNSPSPSKPLEKPATIPAADQAAESRLIHLIRYGLFGLQLVGYTPLSVAKGRRLQWTWLSTPWVYVCVLIIWALFTSSTYITTSSNLVHETGKHYFGRGGQTEVFSAILLIHSISGFTLMHRIWGLLSARRTLEFWKLNVRLLSEFSALGVDYRGRYASVLEKVFKSTRLWFFSFLSLVLTGFGFFYLLMHFGAKNPATTLDAVSNTFQNMHVILLLSYMLSTVYFYLHFTHAIWITLFLKLYSCLFTIIAKEAGDLQFRLRISSTGTLHTPEVNNTIHKCLKLHKMVQRLVGKYNKEFGTKLLAEVLFWCIILLVYLFVSTNWALKREFMNALSAMPTVLLFALMFFILCTTADELTTKSKKILDVLSNIEESCEIHLDAFTSRKIQMLALQLNTNPPRVQPGMFFVVNRQLATTIGCGMVTYLVILVQFQLSEVT